MILTSHFLNVLSSFLSVKTLKKPLPSLSLAFILLGNLSQAQQDSVLEYELGDFERSSYKLAVEELFAAWEEKRGEPIAPGEKRSVGLKVYTSAGPGLATPKGLVWAVIDALIKRGYKTSEIFLIDINKSWLRRSGFLPPLSVGGNTFFEHEVKVVSSGEFFDPLWYYDSPVPPREHYLPGITPMVQEFVENSPEGKSRLPEDRKSFIPEPLIKGVDFWINLPVISDHEVLSLNGALVNATLWNASNTLRFFHSPSNAQVAVAEMAAIPEFRETWALNIVSLEKYQFIGGPQFNSLYTVSEELLLMSADPVAIDFYMVGKMNQWRKRYGFPLIIEEVPMLRYADQLGVGSLYLDPSRIVKIRNSSPN